TTSIGTAPISTASAPVQNRCAPNDAMNAPAASPMPPPTAHRTGGATLRVPGELIVDSSDANTIVATTEPPAATAHPIQVMRPSRAVRDGPAGAGIAAIERPTVAAPGSGQTTPRRRARATTSARTSSSPSAVPSCTTTRPATTVVRTTEPAAAYTRLS